MDIMGDEVDQVLMIAAHDSESQTSPGDAFEYISEQGKECATGFSLSEEILYCQPRMKLNPSFVYLGNLGASLKSDQSDKLLLKWG